MVSDYPFEDLEIENRMLGEIDAEVIDCDKDAEFSEEAKDADAILTTYDDVNREIIESLEKCQIIARYGIGVDNVDIEAATEKGMYVTNVPDYCIHEVADHALALMLTYLRKVIPYQNSTKSGEWDISVGEPIHRLQGLTLGLMGFGKIARELAKKAKAIGLDIITSDPYISEDIVEEIGAELVEKDELIETSDVISVHVPLTDETKHMFSENEFKKMKDNTLIINTSRGPVIDTEALNKAVENGEIQGAALDVMEKEPLEEDNPLLTRDDVIVTPHAGWYSEESLIELREKATSRVIETLQGQKPENLVNEDQL